MTTITQEYLKQILSYDPETGIFRRLKDRSNTHAGDEAGSVNISDGYRQIVIDYRRYAAHRLAVLFMTGMWPIDCLDHINGNRDDNRWSNLRECSVSENNRNTKRPKTNTSGFKGVFTATNGRSWFAQIGLDGKQSYLGTFPTKEAASAAYDDAARSLHGEFARTNEAA